MLIYWIVVMHRAKLRCHDDFNRIHQRWEGGLRSAQLYYLHGALHIYQRPSGSPHLPTIHKITASSRSDLVDNIRSAIDGGESPVLVSEGSAEHKWAQISRNNYLHSAFLRFREACAAAKAALFTFGHSLSEYDRHIAAQIGRGRIQRVYVGVFQDKDVEAVTELAETWTRHRAERRLPPVEVKTFHAAEAKAWGVA